MQKILLDENTLGSLFTEKDFDFLNNKDSYENDINSRLDKAISNREQIVKYILHSENTSTQDSINKNVSAHCEEVFKINNNIIVDLNTLKEGFDQIQKEIIELIIKKENLDCSNVFLKNEIENLKVQINNFDILSTKINARIDSNSIIVTDFLNSFDTEHIEPIYDAQATLEDNNLSSISIDTEEISDNLVLRISEKENKVYLPYSKEEILKYLETYPNVYEDASDVINREFITNLTFYTRHPSLARFREVYSLVHNREMKSIIDALKRAMDLMFRYELNPAIIAGLKSEEELDLLLQCIEENKMDNFTPFKIVFEFNLRKI